MNPKLAALIASLSALGALLTFWPQLQPVLDYAFTKFGLWLTWRQTQAVVMAVLLGSALAFFVPYYLPPGWDKERSKYYMSLVGALLSFAVAAYMVQTFDGLVWAIVAGLAGWPIVRWAAILVFKLRPQAKPESLQ